MAKNIPSPATLDEIDQADTLQTAIQLSKGVMGLTQHMACSGMPSTSAEVDALSELLNLLHTNLCDLQAAMNTEAGTQGAEYWRGYEDGKAAAAASAQQKAIAAQGA